MPTACLLSKPFHAKVDVTLAHGLWKNQRDYVDQTSNSFSLTVIVHLFFEGKTPLRKSLNWFSLVKNISYSDYSLSNISNTEGKQLSSDINTKIKSLIHVMHPLPLFSNITKLSSKSIIEDN